MLARLSATSACSCCHPLFVYPRAPTWQLHISLARQPRRQPFATASRDDGTAHGSHSHGRRGRNALPWPKSPSPTPYEIFNQTREAPYQKAQFYHLVKLYHPDRHHHVSGPSRDHGDGHDHGLSAATMLERYRLVVAANVILSNPAKRRAYDLYGTGWAGRADMHPSYRGADQSWRSRPGSAANNATWEDWERWHDERSGGGRGEKQVQQFMSNGGFAVIVIFFIVLGGIAQVTRAGSTSLTMQEMQDQQHGVISRKLMSQQAGHAPLSRKDRVWSFLERREGWYDLPPSPSLSSPKRSEDSRNGKQL